MTYAEICQLILAYWKSPKRMRRHTRNQYVITIKRYPKAIGMYRVYSGDRVNINNLVRIHEELSLMIPDIKYAQKQLND